MKKRCCFFVGVCFFLILAGCDTYEMFNYYPDDISTVWYCEEIDLEIRYAPNEYGHLAPQVSPLEWKGTTHMVTFGFNPVCFWLFLDTEEETDMGSAPVLSGTWHYEDGNLVVEITEDKIFDDTFEKLVFKPISKNG